VLPVRKWFAVRRVGGGEIVLYLIALSVLSRSSIWLVVTPKFEWMFLCTARLLCAFYLFGWEKKSFLALLTNFHPVLFQRHGTMRAFKCGSSILVVRRWS
jgi:hypothetical protein